MKRYFAPLALSLFFMALSACSGVSETQTPIGAGTPSPLYPETSEQAMLEAADTPAPTVLTTPMTVPVATPAPGQRLLTREEMWVRDRLRAVVSLYNITSKGIEALQSLDVRWMQDQPGFFGSFGYKGWTGVGEARPTGVMHELGHAYWGLFSVTGFPQLSWDAPEGKDISPRASATAAMQRYHRDVLEFMEQPPDHYELLRTRLRNLPELSSSNPDPLLHAIEADAVSTTGGDLELIPPILRKYWDQFLKPGPFHSWYEAFRWYTSLPPEKKKLAAKYIGFEHFDLQEYGTIKASGPTKLQQGVEETLFLEERQRLWDFVETFDMLSAFVLGSPQQEDFKFWRRYLRDKIDLHKQHPELVSTLNLPRSEQIAPALDFLQGLEGKEADEKVALVIQELDIQPFLVHFLPALDNRTLLKLFTSGATLPEGATLKGTAAFVESLEKLTPHIKKILEAGRRDISRGADELTSYLNKVDFQQKEALELFFEILQGSDNKTAMGVVAALDDSMLRRLLVPVPSKLRALLKPARLLEFLDITLDSSPTELIQGIEDMITYPSGNFRIDEPFLDGMYRVVAARSRRAPLETLNTIASSPFPLERFISLHPAAAVDLLATDLDITSEMVKHSDPLIFHPARFVCRLIYADPEFAARLVEQLDELNEDRLVLETLAHFAYDADRLQAVPSLHISVERDGRFLKRLLEDKGAEWLEGRMTAVVMLYSGRVERNEVPDDFLEAYKKTLRAAASRLEDRKAGRTLEEIIGRVFR